MLLCCCRSLCTLPLPASHTGGRAHRHTHLFSPTQLLYIIQTLHLSLHLSAAADVSAGLHPPSTSSSSFPPPAPPRTHFLLWHCSSSPSQLSIFALTAPLLSSSFPLSFHAPACSPNTHAKAAKQATATERRHQQRGSRSAERKWKNFERPERPTDQ